MTRPALYAAVLIVVAALRLTAQTPLRFEVASVKQNLSGDVGGKIQVPPAGTVTYINVPLRILIRDAYQVDAYAEPYMLGAGRWSAPLAAPAPAHRRRTFRDSTSRGSPPRTRRLLTDSR